MKKNILLLAYGYTAECALQSLLGKFNVVGVVTPEVEKNIYRPQDILPIEKLAESNSVKIIRSNKPSVIKDIVQAGKVDVVVISSYNKIIPAEILKLTKFINVHHG